MIVKISANGGKTMLKNSIVEMLLRKRAAVVHIQGGLNERMLVTVEIEGEYLTGSVLNFSEAMLLIHQGVKKIITNFMEHILDSHGAMLLAVETAEYYNLFLDDGTIPAQLVHWAEEVVSKQSISPTPLRGSAFRRILQRIGAGSFFLFIAIFI